MKEEHEFVRNKDKKKEKENERCSARYGGVREVHAEEKKGRQCQRLVKMKEMSTCEPLPPVLHFLRPLPVRVLW